MEKPMGITVFQARILRGLAAEQKRLLHVGFNRHTIPLVKTMLKDFLKISKVTHVEGRFYKNANPSFYGGCASSFICDVIHVTDLVRHIAAGGPGKIQGITKAFTLERINPGSKIPEAWNCSMEFENGVTGLVRADYRTGGRVHQFEIHGPGASAFIDLGFGDAGCSGRILKGVSGRQSLASGGAADHVIIEYNGIKIAGSDKYEDYYGYRDEDQAFIRAMLKTPVKPDLARSAEDLSSMELSEKLLEVRVKQVN
jgi:predicted dehydrogenase